MEEYTYISDPKLILKVLYNSMNVYSKPDSPALQILDYRIEESIKIATTRNENDKPEFKLMERARQLLNESITFPEPDDTLISDSIVFKRQVMRYDIEDLLATM